MQQDTFTEKSQDFNGTCYSELNVFSTFYSTYFKMNTFTEEIANHC